MVRREYSHVTFCAAGCGEREFYVFDNRRDHDSHVRYRNQNPFICDRHRAPEVVLSTDQPTGQVTYAVILKHRRKTFSNGTKTVSRLGSPSEGFMVFADDLPLGAQVLVTVALSLPEHTASEPSSEVAVT